MPGKRGRVSKGLTSEEIEKCTVLLEKGYTWEKISSELKRPQNSIYYLYTSANKDYKRRRKEGKRPDQTKIGFEEVDLSALPETEIFKHDRSYLF